MEVTQRSSIVRSDSRPARKNLPLLFVNKSANSGVLSRSSGTERSLMFQHVQRKHRARRPKPPRSSPLDYECLEAKNSRNGRPGSDHEDLQPVNDVAIATFDPARLSNGSIWHSQIVVKFVERETKIVSQQLDSVELTPFMWTTSLPSLLGRWNTVDFSLLALSGTAVGQRDNNQALVTASFQAYGKSLSGLQQTLASKATELSDEVICTCLLLISFQLFSRTLDSAGWAAHANGLAQIIRLRGPESFQTGPAHKYFLIARSKIIHRALIDQKRTFLAETRWRIGPWELSVKSDYERLMDCMSSLPGLCELSCKVERITGKARRIEALQMFLQECFSLLSRFQSWFDTLPDNSKSIAAELGGTSNSSRRTLDSTACSKGVCLGSLAITAAIMKYWACLIEVHLLINWATSALKNEGEGPILIENSSDDSISTTISLAVQICISAQYCVQTDLRYVGQHYVSFPLGKALKAFRLRLPETQAELRWCEVLIGTAVKQ